MKEGLFYVCRYGIVVSSEMDENGTQIIQKVWSHEQAIIERWQIARLLTAAVVNNSYRCCDRVFLNAMMGNVMCHGWTINGVNDFLVLLYM